MNRLFRRVSSAAALATVTALLIAGCSTPSGDDAGGDEAPSWPTGPVDFSVGAGPGGGADIMAREISRIVQDEGFASQPFQVVNRAGGALCVAMTHLAENSGNSEIVMVWTTTILATKLRGNCDTGYDDVTPVALVAQDPYLIMVSADKGIDDLNDLVDLAESRGEGNPINVGGGSEGGPDHIAAATLADAAGIDTNFVPFDSGADAVAALLGGSIDAVIGNPAEFASQIEAGNITALASLTEEPLEGLNDVPTATEQGVDAVYMVWRGFGAPADLPAADLDAMIDLFQKVSESKEWQQYLSDNYLVSDFITGDEFTAYLDESNDKNRQILTDLGIISG